MDFESWVNDQSESQRVNTQTQISRLLARASRGELPVTSDEVKAVMSVAGLFELRWQIAQHPGELRTSAAHIRLYFCEPEDLPDLLVSLHLHLKEVEGLSNTKIRELQNEEIAIAARRQIYGKHRKWH